ncbi:hypothetical protein WJX72_007547 [[Myrmecia] bisecta]|uniref:SEC7 domain-containing protein n=1 Tax=[Myrmecia] bisecta TaxID=41462 RepID=A0AAW1PD53_9CHLO
MVELVTPLPGPLSERSKPLSSPTPSHNSQSPLLPGSQLPENGHSPKQPQTSEAQLAENGHSYPLANGLLNGHQSTVEPLLVDESAAAKGAAGPLQNGVHNSGQNGQGAAVEAHLEPTGAAQPAHRKTNSIDLKAAAAREAARTLPSTLDSYDGAKVDDRTLFKRLAAANEELPPAAQAAMDSLPSAVTTQTSKGVDVVDVDIEVPDQQKPRLSLGANPLAAASSDDLLRSNLLKDAKTVARFLRTCPGLSRTIIGNLLGENNEGCLRVLDEFTRSFSFEGMEFDQALRIFLESFRLPGESQKIYRFMDSFGKYYHQQCPGVFNSPDAVHILAFSVVMLNTDAHNSKVKKKMTCEEFIRNNRGINDGSDLPADFLSNIYKSIQRRAIRIPSHHGDELDPVFNEAVAAKQKSSTGFSCFGKLRVQ